MKPRILLTIVAVMSSALVAPALATGDAYADQVQLRQARQTTSRSIPRASRDQCTASTTEAGKANDAKCVCEGTNDAREHMVH